MRREKNKEKRKLEWKRYTKIKHKDIEVWVYKSWYSNNTYRLWTGKDAVIFTAYSHAEFLRNCKYYINKRFELEDE